MVRIVSLVAGVLALACASEACGGWYQCKNADKSHCCVVDSGIGIHRCPKYCTGGPGLVECIGQGVGNARNE
ncbi:hypothetical protein E4U53_007418 [Claviceps sorghi]|nr:hypothetical protein E4U53_007418 [Claviceps sorghi]